MAGSFFADSAQETLKPIIQNYIENKSDIKQLTEEIDLHDENKFQNKILRLAQVLIIELKDARIDRVKYKLLFKKFYSASEGAPLELLEEVIERYNRNISLYTHAYQDRNICLVLLNIAAYLIDGDCDDKNDYKVDTILDFMCTNIFTQCKNQEAILYAILFIERLYFNKCHFNGRIVEILSSSTSEQCQNICEINFDPLNLLKNQITFCEHWLLCRARIPAIDSLPQFNKIPLIKFWPNSLIVRCDNFSSYENQLNVPVRSMFGVSTGRFYYEVTFMTHTSSMRIGWMNDKCKLTTENQIGDDKNSIALDVGKKVLIYNNSEITRKVTIADFKEGDVIGLLIEIKKEHIIFEFYLNEKQMKFSDINFDFQLKAKAFYAVASLPYNQQCHFNFGEVKFAYAEQNGYTHFDRFNQISTQKHCLLEPVLTNNLYWFKQENLKVNTQLSVSTFEDDHQIAFDRMVIKMQIQSSKDNTDVETFERELNCDIEHFLSQSSPYLRFIQSVINETKNENISDNKTDIMASWIQHCCKKLLPKFQTTEYITLLEMLYPLMKIPLKYDRDRNIMLKRYVLIIISITARLDKKRNYFKNYEILLFLLKTLKARTDSWSTLYAIKCLETVVDDNKISLQNKRLQVEFENVLNFLRNNLKKYSIEMLIESGNICLQYQISTCAQWYWSNVFEAKIPEINPNVKLHSDETVNSVRNDKITHITVRSSTPSTTDEVYFYQALLLTSGEMGFGWINRESELEKGKKLGHYNHSIGYCGYRKEVLQNFIKSVNQPNQSQIEIDNSESIQWATGDVVTCINDVKKQEFTFYLNTKLIYQKIITESTKYYYPAVTLSSGQQCCLFTDKKFLENKLKNGKECTIQLLEPSFIEKSYWFKEKESDKFKQINFYFYNKQPIFEEKVSKLLYNSEFDKLYIKKLSNKLPSCIRLIEAIIVSKYAFKNVVQNFHKINHFGKWISILMHNLDQTQFLAKFLELLYPYMQRPILNALGKAVYQSMHRKICIVLSLVHRHLLSPLKSQINSTIYDYLERIFFECLDKTTLLFAISVLKIYAKEPENAKIINNETKMRQILKQLSNQSINFQDKGSIKFQVGFCAEILIDTIENNKIKDEERAGHNSANSVPSNSATNELSEKWTESLTIRSDSGYKTIRYSRFSKNHHMYYYYEVRINTYGKIRIGWATEALDIKSKIGYHSTSIGFDGFSCRLWRCVDGKEKYHQLGDDAKWKVGDTVGCLINIAKSEIAFYINQNIVSFDNVLIEDLEEHFVAQTNYFAAVTLSCYQQIEVNFGTTFKNKPSVKYETLKTFENASNVNNYHYSQCFNKYTDSIHAEKRASVTVEDVNIKKTYELPDYPNKRQCIDQETE